jgi:RNA polymerase sigma-70 factor, ECF subfamily
VTVPREPRTASQVDGPPDGELVQLARRDRAAFGRLYERYVDRIYSYLYYRTDSTADAEDLTARTFYQALSHLDDFEERGLPFSAWLFTIAHNLTVNYYRERSRRPTAPLDSAGERAAPSPFAAAEDAQVVRDAISVLSPERQHLILLKYVEGMSNAEIGRAMNRSEGAIKSLLRRTLAELRRNLERSRDAIP